MDILEELTLTSSALRQNFARVTNPDLFKLASTVSNHLSLIEGRSYQEEQEHQVETREFWNGFAADMQQVMSSVHPLAHPLDVDVILEMFSKLFEKFRSHYSPMPEDPSSLTPEFRPDDLSPGLSVEEIQEQKEKRKEKAKDRNTSSQRVLAAYVTFWKSLGAELGSEIAEHPLWPKLCISFFGSLPHLKNQAISCFQQFPSNVQSAFLSSRYTSEEKAGEQVRAQPDFLILLKEGHYELANLFFQAWTVPELDKLEVSPAPLESWNYSVSSAVPIWRHSLEKPNSLHTAQARPIIKWYMGKYNFDKELPWEATLLNGRPIRRPLHALEYLAVHEFNPCNTSLPMLEMMLEQDYKAFHLARAKGQYARKPLIHYVLKKATPEKAILILEKRPQWWNYKTERGKGIAHLVSSAPVARYLLEKGVDFQARDDYGNMAILEVMANGVFNKKEELRQFALQYIKQNNISLDEKYLNYTLADLLQSRKPLLKAFGKLVDKQKKILTAAHWFMNMKWHLPKIQDQWEEIIPVLNSPDLLERTPGHLLWLNRNSSLFFYEKRLQFFSKMLDSGLDLGKLFRRINSSYKQESVSVMGLFMQFGHHRQATPARLGLDPQHKKRDEYAKKQAAISKNCRRLAKTLLPKIARSYDWATAPGWTRAASQNLASFSLRSLSYSCFDQEKEHWHDYDPPIAHMLVGRTSPLWEGYRKLPPAIKGDILYYFLQGLKDKDFNRTLDDQHVKTFSDLLEGATVTPNILRKFRRLAHTGRQVSRPGYLPLVQEYIATLEANSLKVGMEQKTILPAGYGMKKL